MKANSKMFFPFSAFDYWLYVPLVATHLGAVVGSTMYDLFIRLHLDDPANEDQDESTIKV